MKRAAFLGVAVALTSAHAWADGPVTAYDNGGPVQSTLDPGEYVTNADGAKEDPNHHMSDVARAYRNGLINGRAEQKDIDAKQQASVPPIPPLPVHYAPVANAAPLDDAPPPPVVMPPAFVPPPPPPPPVIAQYAYPYAPPPPPPQYAYAYAPPPPPPVYVQPTISVGVPVYRGGYWWPQYRYGYGRRMAMRWRRW
jgi:hypothetical protein